jgi:hypothetical protein
VDSGVGAETCWLGLLVGFVAVATLILGISSFMAHVADQRSHN